MAKRRRANSIDLGDAAAARPPRILAPLQHMFDPVIGPRTVHARSPRWGESRVPLTRFSDFPQIVFDRLAALPADDWPRLLRQLQLRLTDGKVVTRCALPPALFCQLPPAGDFEDSDPMLLC